jgi:hypothetical protein
MRHFATKLAQRFCAAAFFSLNTITVAAIGPLPSAQITGFVSPPINSCDLPYATLAVEANGDATTSDTFFIYANGSEIYRWSGENMSWAQPPGPNTYSVAGEFAGLAPGTTLTAAIVTYDSANPLGPLFYAGNAIYRSQISWNCTSGAQLGNLSNEDLRPREIPLLSTDALVGLALLLASLVSMHLRRGERLNRAEKSRPLV